jgi:hypothetical protein
MIISAPEERHILLKKTQTRFHSYGARSNYYSSTIDFWPLCGLEYVSTIRHSKTIKNIA